MREEVDDFQVRSILYILKREAVCSAVGSSNVMRIVVKDVRNRFGRYGLVT